MHNSRNGVSMNIIGSSDGVLILLFKIASPLIKDLTKVRNNELTKEEFHSKWSNSLTFDEAMNTPLWDEDEEFEEEIVEKGNFLQSLKAFFKRNFALKDLIESAIVVLATNLLGLVLCLLMYKLGYYQLSKRGTKFKFKDVKSGTLPAIDVFCYVISKLDIILLVVLLILGMVSGVIPALIMTLMTILSGF